MRTCFLFSVLLLTTALAEEPTTAVVPRVSRVEKTEVSAMACHAVGPSGAAEVSNLTEQVVFLYPQIKGSKTCGNFVVQINGGRVCSTKTNGTDEICSWSSGLTESDMCVSREEALRDQVARIETCSGISPAPRQSTTVQRRAPS
jgi:hypothetical protein